jgi:hypothetical protein
VNLRSLVVAAVVVLAASPGSSSAGSPRGGARSQAGLPTLAAKATQPHRQPEGPRLRAGPLIRIDRAGFASKAEYTDLHHAVGALLQRYRPDRHFFIGAGRDPAPIMALLHVLGGDELAMNFPASGSGMWMQENSRPSDAVVEPYFTKLIPRSVIEGKRDIVLVDQTDEGRTLSGFSPVLQRYLDRVGFKGRLRKVAFSRMPQKAGIDVIDISAFPIVGRFLIDPYEGALSEFPRHLIGYDDPKALVRRREYRRYQDALRRRLEHDPGAYRILDPGASSGSGLGRWQPRRTFRYERGKRSDTLTLRMRIGHLVINEKYLDPLEYLSLRNISIDLMRDAPPRENFYLGVGPASAPVVAFLSNLGSRIAAYLPVSGLEKLGPTLTAAQRKDLEALFDRTLPAGALTGGRSVALFQSDGDARGVDLVRDALIQYLRDKGSETWVEVVELRKWGTAGVDLGATKFALLAPYPSPAPGTVDAAAPTLRPDGRLVPRNPRYGKFERALAGRMKGDEQLSRWVNDLFGATK